MGFLVENIYPNMPLFIQNIGISMFGYKWHKRRFGGIFKKELKQVKERENYSTEQWKEYQTVTLRKLLSHSINTVPYYRELFNKSNLTEAKINKFELYDLKLIPFLEKQTLRTLGKTSLLSNELERGGEFFASSGSTGTPTQILFSYPMHQRWSAAFEARIRHWAGVDRFTPRGMIGGRRVVAEGHAKPPFYRYNLIEKQVYMSAYHISAQTASNYLQGMIKNHVEYMTGYAMSNFFLARFFDELKLDAPQLKAILTSSEKLTPDMRVLFHRVYGCKTYDSWSGVEACGLISECEHGNLHISPDVGIIEILDENGEPCPPGKDGEIVCTGFINFDQPLIRYRIGDIAQIDDKQCGCGRTFPVIKEILGRIEDVVIGKDGREMVRFHGLFTNLPNIIEGQIIQHTDDNFTVNIVSNGKFSPDEEEVIKKRLNSQLGDIKIIIREVQEIPRMHNGKFKSVISHVNRQFH
jgi:phenylacetate-CoA ligase